MEFSGSKSLRTEPCRYYWGRAGQSVLELEGWAFFDMPAAIGRATATNLRMAHKKVRCMFVHAPTGARVRSLLGQEHDARMVQHCRRRQQSCTGLNWAAAPLGGSNSDVCHRT